MKSQSLIVLCCVLAYISERLLPLYCIFLIRFYHASGQVIVIVLTTELLTCIGGSIIGLQIPLLSSPKFHVLVFILLLLAFRRRGDRNDLFLIQRIQLPYVVFTNGLSIFKTNYKEILNMHTQAATKLFLMTTDDGMSLKCFLKSILNSPIGTTKETLCTLPSIDQQIECKKYRMYCIKFNEHMILTIFINVTAEVMKKQNESYDKLKLDITSTISHELRNPLNGVIGILQHLKDTTYTTEKASINIGISSALLLKYSIDRFIDLSQIMSNEIHIEQNELNITTFALNVKKLFTPLICSDIDFIIKIDNLAPKKIANDTEKIMRIIVRLISNSIKYTSKGSIVFEICLRTNNELEFSVSDTGTGIKSDTISAIRRSAVSLIPDRPHTDNIHLSGLGLATVQLVLEKLNSKLTIQSKLQHGSKFSFILTIKESSCLLMQKLNNPISLIEMTDLRIRPHRVIPDEYNETEGIYGPYSKFEPKLPCKKPSKAKLMKRIASLINTVHAMVVDDCSVNRLVHKMLLDRYSNFKITEHTNGKEAVDYLSILKENQPEKVLILMDINMPIMDGLTATKTIRQNKYKFPIIIIAISAFSDENDVKQIEECGMDSYITKPVTKDNLQKILTLYC